ncbi:MAG: glycosyltransferase family 39 protein [Candidatus Omnitrophica bacterium]|nr:glycosyltransferase family 39 protein [Candidatus Omnitrophota bacterium]
MKASIIIIIIFILCAYLGLKGLGNTYFWDDEAEVGIMARNLISKGYLTGWDGRNLFAFRNGSLLDKDLKPKNPPLQYLVTAASFLVFGDSAWPGRLPSVVLGLLSLFVFFLLLKHDFDDKKPLWIYAFAMLALSVTFLLNIRQCRYYALCLFFPLVIFYSYRVWLKTKKNHRLIIATIASILFFYSHFLLCAAFLLSLGISHLLFYLKEITIREYKKLFLAITFFVLTTLPYALINSILYRPDFGSYKENWFLDKIRLLWWNIRDLNLINCLPWVVFISLVYFLVRHRKEKQIVNNSLRWIVICFGYVFFLTLFSPQATDFTSIADVRYLVPIIPFLAGLTGVFLWFVHRKMKLLALALFLTIINTNLLALTPSNYKFRWLLPAYIYEIHNKYPTPYSVSVDFLLQNAKQDDLVYAFPEYCNYPLMFYTTDKLRFCSLLNYKTPLAVDKVKKLSSVLFIEENFPDWFVVFGKHSGAMDLLGYFSRPHQNNGKKARFSYDLAAVLDVYWLDMTRPELPWHNFGPNKNFDRNVEAVYIFRRSGPIEVR